VLAASTERATTYLAEPGAGVALPAFLAWSARRADPDTGACTASSDPGCIRRNEQGQYIDAHLHTAAT
jgi:hypothetical protein